MRFILQDVLSAPHDYDQDIVIALDYNDQGHPEYLKFATYNSNDNWTWGEENKQKTTSEINKMLIEWGYHAISKYTKEQPFDLYWDYRLDIPEWSRFRLWLYVFYANKEEREVSNELKEAYQEIFLKLGNLADPCPPLHEIVAFAQKKYREHEYDDNREIKYVYDDLREIVETYAGWAGNLRVNA